MPIQITNEERIIKLDFLNIFVGIGLPNTANNSIEITNASKDQTKPFRLEEIWQRGEKRHIVINHRKVVFSAVLFLLLRTKRNTMTETDIGTLEEERLIMEGD